jgi:hypothetical protein
VVVFDAADIDVESAFWAALLGGTVSVEEDWHSVLVDGEPQQVHLDLYVDDIHAAHEQALAAGAVLLRAATDFSTPDGFQVYADPAGHPFCLCWGP